jgi:cell division protein FtsI (penicillin-binding protein 3)
MNDPTVSPWIRRRMAICATLLFLLLGLVVRRAYTLQAVEGGRLRELAEQQYLKETEIPPRRGNILDRHETPLATSVEVDSVYANPRLLNDRVAAVARELSAALELDPWKLQTKLSARRYFAWVKRRISPQQASKVRQLHIPGIYLTKESQRYYPNHGLGSCVVGFAGADAKGLEGVELSYDGWLRGEPIRLAGLRDAMGRQVFSEGVQAISSSSHDLQLTLDKFVQYETEQALIESSTPLKPQTGWSGAVVMDPQTGDVLAMATNPSYDPNLYYKAKPAQWRNRVVADAFEPGSTLKIFSMATALELGLVRMGEIFDCEKGRLRVGHYTLHDAHRHDKLDLTGVLQKSSNIGMSKIAFRVGKAALYRYLSRFGFGQATGSNLPGERAGVLRPAERWSDVALANVSFGQGMTTTMMQLAQALSAIANGGVMMQPRLAISVRNDRGEPVKKFAPQGQRVIRQSVAERMLSMMVSVTEDGGTGVDAALDRYTVAGKTGTAQKVDPVTRTYSTERWVSSFIGAVPASKPRLVIVVVINEPDGDKHYGGEVAGPIFKRIAEKTLAYLGVKPDRQPRKPRPAALPSRAVAAEGFLDSDSDPAPPLPGEGGAGSVVKIPDFTGMSMDEVIGAAQRANLELELRGSGQAVAQSPGPGPAVKRTVCRVSFRPPG